MIKEGTLRAILFRGQKTGHLLWGWNSALFDLTHHHLDSLDVGQTTKVEFEFDGATVLPASLRIPLSAAVKGITDQALGTALGNRRRRNQTNEVPGYSLTSFGNNVSGVAGLPHDIDRNPYNFVELGPSPWLESGANGIHAGHAQWDSELLTGTLRFTLVARTPVFVPMGFPWKDDPERVPRHFCQLHKSESGKVVQRYAIPGSSLKGAIRTMVEAVSNDRFGVGAREDFAKSIPYRRRAFQVGLLKKKCEGGDGWDVAPARQPRFGQVDAQHPMFLLARTAAHRTPKRVNKLNGAPFHLSQARIDEYEANLEHPHYRRYAETYEKVTADRAKYPHHPFALRSTQYRVPLEPNFEDAILAPLKQLNPGNPIYYTRKQNQITSFGKNANYLWPSKYSIAELANLYFQEPGALGLDKQLGLAESIFGYANPKTKHGNGDGNRDGDGDALRGKLSIETGWGPETNAKPITLALAPLTSPATIAKARPLYLQPNAGGRSASYSDEPPPTLRGRKFYWKQAPPNGEVIWKYHTADQVDRSDVQSQCPPPILALPKATTFDCALSFRNLTAIELGALLFVLGHGQGRDYAIHIGKGKPRGLGVCQIQDLTVQEDTPSTRYDKLGPLPAIGGSECRPPEASEATARPDRLQEFAAAFRSWVERRAGGTFEQVAQIRDFRALQRWTGQPKIHYYPVNFADYGWLPAENWDPDEPKRVLQQGVAFGDPELRPIGMKLARDLDEESPT